MSGHIQHRPTYTTTSQDGTRQERKRPRPWKARYRGPDGREHTRSFRLKVEAERWLRDELGKADRGQWVDPAAGAVAFGDWSEEWLGSLDVKPKTAAGYRELLDSRILPIFGPVELRQITPVTIRHWIAEMSADGLSASRIKQARGILRAALELAVVDGLIGRNSATGVKVPTARTREQRFLTAAEVVLLADAADERRPGAGLIIETLAYVGLRFGELVALRRSSIDILRRRIAVSEAATEIGGNLVFGTPKTHESRTVVMPSVLAEHFACHLGQVEPEGLVFTSPQGGPLRGSNFRVRVWRPAVVAAGLDPDLTPHDLRHTAASLMIASGASIKAVQRQLGHASATMTLDRYGHLYEEDLDALAIALDAKLADVGWRAQVPALTQTGERPQ
ncbi:MAG: tyrosine-type recombinase/integrase [Acidimicrobiia bacterium]